MNGDHVEQQTAQMTHSIIVHLVNKTYELTIVRWSVCVYGPKSMIWRSADDLAVSTRCAVSGSGVLEFEFCGDAKRGSQFTGAAQ